MHHVSVYVNLHFRSSGEETMATNLKQFMKLHVSLATITFACAAILAIPFLIPAVGFITVARPTQITTEQPNDVALIDVDEIDSPLQLYGSLMARSDSHTVTALTFTLGNAIGATPIKLMNNALEI